jgi:hypothetical protein
MCSTPAASAAALIAGPCVLAYACRLLVIHRFGEATQVSAFVPGASHDLLSNSTHIYCLGTVPLRRPSRAAPLGVRSQVVQLSTRRAPTAKPDQAIVHMLLAPVHTEDLDAIAGMMIDPIANFPCVGRAAGGCVIRTRPLPIRTSSAEAFACCPLPMEKTGSRFERRRLIPLCPLLRAACWCPLTRPVAVGRMLALPLCAASLRQARSGGLSGSATRCARRRLGSRASAS